VCREEERPGRTGRSRSRPILAGVVAAYKWNPIGRRPARAPRRLSPAPDVTPSPDALRPAGGALKVRDSGKSPRLGSSLLTADAKRRLKLLSKLAIVGVVAFFVHRSILAGWNGLEEEIRQGRWSLDRLRWQWLVAAAGLYVLGQLPNGLFWRSILRSLGATVPLGTTLRAFYIGHLGKYVPGKAMVVVMRTSLLVPHGVRPATAAVSVFYETLTMMAVGALVSAVIIAVRFRDHLDWLLGAAAMVVVTGLPVVPAIFMRVVRKLRVGRADEAEASGEIGRLTAWSLAGGWLLVTSGWFLSGASIAATLRAAGFAGDSPPIDQWVVCTAAAALSVVVGFLSFVPGGFFVREAVIITFLGPTYGEKEALVAAVLVRLVWLVAELSVSVILYRSGTRPRPGPLPGTSPAPPPAKP
jgi:glycosyltransferase 2 family protein